MSTTAKDYYSIKTVMEKADIRSPQTVYNMIARGDLVAVKLGNMTRITVESYEALGAKHPLSN